MRGLGQKRLDDVGSAAFGRVGARRGRSDLGVLARALVAGVHETDALGRLHHVTRLVDGAGKPHPVLHAPAIQVDGSVTEGVQQLGIGAAAQRLGQVLLEVLRGVLHAQARLQLSSAAHVDKPAGKRRRAAGLVGLLNGDHLGARRDRLDCGGHAGAAQTHDDDVGLVRPNDRARVNPALRLRLRALRRATRRQRGSRQRGGRDPRSLDETPTGNPHLLIHSPSSVRCLFVSETRFRRGSREFCDQGASRKVRRPSCHGTQREAIGQSIDLSG